MGVASDMVSVDPSSTDILTLQEIVNAGPQEPCQQQAKMFSDCMVYNNGELGACQHYFDGLQQCRLAL
jgi:CHCH domain